MRFAVGRVGLMVGSGLLIGLAGPAESAPITSQMNFATTGTVGSTGVTGTPILSFQGTDGGSLTTGSAFNLGSFVVSMPPTGSTTTYNQTPFTIQFSPQAVDGSAISGGSPITLHGWINGSIGNGSSTASFSVDRLAYPFEETPNFPSYVTPFRVGRWVDSIFDAPGSSDDLAPAGGSTLIRAVIEAEPAPATVPEPSTIAVIAAGIGLFVVRRFQARRSVG